MELHCCCCLPCHADMRPGSRDLRPPGLSPLRLQQRSHVSHAGMHHSCMYHPSMHHPPCGAHIFIADVHKSSPLCPCPAPPALPSLPTLPSSANHALPPPDCLSCLSSLPCSDGSPGWSCMPQDNTPREIISFIKPNVTIQFVQHFDTYPRSAIPPQVCWGAGARGDHTFVPQRKPYRVGGQDKWI